jgi:hypothetical protein
VKRAVSAAAVAMIQTGSMILSKAEGATRA